MGSALDTARSRSGYYGVLGCVCIVSYRGSSGAETMLWCSYSLRVGLLSRSLACERIAAADLTSTSPPLSLAAGPARPAASLACAACSHAYIVMIRMYVVFYRSSYGVKTMLCCSYSLRMGHLSPSHWHVTPVVSHGRSSSPHRVAADLSSPPSVAASKDGPAVQLAFGT